MGVRVSGVVVGWGLGCAGSYVWWGWLSRFVRRGVVLRLSVGVTLRVTVRVRVLECSLLEAFTSLFTLRLLTYCRVRVRVRVRVRAENRFVREVAGWGSG